MPGSERNKPLKDIRYFDCPEIPLAGLSMPPGDTELLGIPKSAQRVGQRIACLLQVQGFSVGPYDHVYVAFTPALAQAEVAPTDFGFEPWQRYVGYGLGSAFRSMPEDEKLRCIQTATLDVLRALQPSQAELIDSTSEYLRAHGPRARILRATKHTRSHRFDVWFDVPAWRERSYLYITARHESTGELSESPPYPLHNYADVFPLVSSIAFSQGTLTLNPRKSSQAERSTRSYETPLKFPLSAFVAQVPVAAARANALDG